jgi:hypothetical protein
MLRSGNDILLESHMQVHCIGLTGRRQRPRRLTPFLAPTLLSLDSEGDYARVILCVRKLCHEVSPSTRAQETSVIYIIPAIRPDL